MSATKKIVTTKPGDIHKMLDTILDGWGSDGFLMIRKAGEKPFEGLTGAVKRVNGEQKLSEQVWEVEVTIYGDGEGFDVSKNR